MAKILIKMVKVKGNSQYDQRPNEPNKSLIESTCLTNASNQTKTTSIYGWLKAKTRYALKP
jgi:hypothetical protein